VRLGKAFENLMVDVRPTSAKLVDRSRRIVAAAGRVDAGEARRLLRRAGGDVKTAIVMARSGVTAREARALLARAHGHVRSALQLA